MILVAIAAGTIGFIVGVACTSILVMSADIGADE